MYDYLHIGSARDTTNRRDYRLYRALEILPGVLAWGTLILIVVLAFTEPVWTAFFIIAFDIYWLLKTIYLSLHMRSTFNKMRSNLKKDWFLELSGVTARAPELNGASWQDLYHLVVLPMYREPLAIVRESIRSLTKIKYPLDKLIVVLAIEERAGEEARNIAHSIEQEFGSLFFKFTAIEHPGNQEGEVTGKGSNEAWAGKEVQKQIIDPLGLPHEYVIVSVFDIDTVVHPNFFGCLSWNYLTALHPLHSSFQPIPLFTNNIWEAPAFARVFAFSTTFWQMIQQARPERLVTFSSQSISLKALVDVGFWQTNVVSEDSRIYWQCLLRYDGNWRTIPMYFPVYMDANVAPTFWQTLKNQYRQIRRWHFGVENNPYFLFGFIKNKKIPLIKRVQISAFMVETTHSSATNALIIFLLGWLPLMSGNLNFYRDVLSYNLPQMTRLIMNFAMVGLVTSAIITIMLLPPRPPKYGRFAVVWMILQWILFPINIVFFGAIPALDAQTRLMLGKYLGFWVTPKSRFIQNEIANETPQGAGATRDSA